MKKLLITVIVVIAIVGTLQAQDWKPNPKYIQDTTTSIKVSYQCNGTTKKGLRCKHKVGKPGDYCFQHINQK